MAKAIHEIRQSCEDDRPDLARKRVQGLDKSSRVNYDIIRGKVHDVELWSPWELFCAEPGKTPLNEWDYFAFTSTSGILSRRAVDELDGYLRHCFVPLPSTLDGKPFYFLHCHSPIDCLDIDASEAIYFPPPDDADVMQINKYAFKKDLLLDPLIFTTPQEPWVLFATESIPEIVKKAGLKGFAFRELDT